MVIVIVIVVVIICNESMYSSSCLVLFFCGLESSWLDLSWLVLLLLLWAWRCMGSSYITISYHISCSYILSLLLICSPLYSVLFYSILLYFKLIRFDSILFDFIEFDSLYCSVLYLISMNDLCLSVRLSTSLCE